MKSFNYVVTDAIGFHVRPVTLLANLAMNFQSRILISYDGQVADATKVMALMSLGVKNGANVQMTCEGEDEQAAVENMEIFFKDHL